jgi:hypothetical protein
MPLIKGKNVADEVAVQQGFCPETGKPLADIEDIDAHILHLWPKDRSPEAEKRIAMLKKYAASRPAPAAASSDDSK